MELAFSGVMFEWRGPSPFHFVALPPEEAEDVKLEASRLTYGWGMIPATVVIGETTFTTAMYAKEGTYWVPIKDVARRAEELELGDVVDLVLRLDT